MQGPISASKPHEPSPDPALGVFFYDYKPAAWYTKHLDLGLLLLLSLFRALLPRPTTLAGIAGKTATVCVALLASCAHVLWVRPYLEADAWMGWVRALLLMDSLGVTLLGATTLAMDAGLRTAQSGPLRRRRWIYCVLPCVSARWPCCSSGLVGTCGATPRQSRILWRTGNVGIAPRQVQPSTCPESSTVTGSAVRTEGPD